jgi:Xaa-Pro aminopeptidase
MIVSERRKKCLEELKKSGLDGLLFATGANLQYLSESVSYFWQRNCMNGMAPVAGSHILPEAIIYMNREGRTTVLTIPSKKDHFDTTKNEIIVSYMDQFEDELRHIVDGKKIGVGRDCEDWFRRTLKEVDPAIEVCGAEWIFDDIRRIKDEKEIDQMRKLARFTDEAVMYVVRHMREGMTMFECERGIIDYGLSHGIQDLSFPPTCGFKTRDTENAQNIEPFEPERRLVPGTMVAFDIGYMDQGYCSDWGRTVYYGKAPELVRKGYEALQAAECYMISQIRPGVTKFGQIYSFICDKAEELGYYEYLRFKREDRGGNGHHIGTDVHEVPFMSSDSQLVLQPGMIFCSEPKMFFPNEGYMRVEDMILVTEDGAESLTQFPRDLFEI